MEVARSSNDDEDSNSLELETITRISELCSLESVFFHQDSSSLIFVCDFFFAVFLSFCFLLYL